MNGFLFLLFVLTGGMAFMITGPVVITADVSSGKVLVFGLASVLLEPLRCQNIVNQVVSPSILSHMHLEHAVLFFWEKNFRG